MRAAALVRTCLDGSLACATPHLNPKLSEMCEAATRALQDEDRVVRDALLKGRELRSGAYEALSPGLAYWVFETGLVYTIWKAWVPKMATRWEHRYASATSKAADLAVFPSSEEGWVFEAKWFNSNTKAAQDIVLGDVTKLATAELAQMSNPLRADTAPLAAGDASSSPFRGGIQPRSRKTGDHSITFSGRERTSRSHLWERSHRASTRTGAVMTRQKRSRATSL